MNTAQMNLFIKLLELFSTNDSWTEARFTVELPDINELKRASSMVLDHKDLKVIVQYQRITVVKEA